MSKRNYKIERIDAIVQHGAINSVPAFYVQGDDDLFQLFNFYKGRAPIKIHGTNSAYDNKLSYASLQPSQFTGGFRPNFQQETGLLCIIPEFAWDGYPPKTGELEILYRPQEVQLKQDYQYLGGMFDDCKRKTLCKLFFILFLVVLTILLVNNK